MPEPTLAGYSLDAEDAGEVCVWGCCGRGAQGQGSFILCSWWCHLGMPLLSQPEEVLPERTSSIFFFFCNFHKVQLRIEPGRRKLVHRPPSEVSWKLIPVPSTLPSLFLLPFPLPSFGSHALEYYFPCHDCEWILYLRAHTITSKNKSQVIKYCNVQRCHASQ